MVVSGTPVPARPDDNASLTTPSLTGRTELTRPLPARRRSNGPGVGDVDAPGTSHVTKVTDPTQNELETSQAVQPSGNAPSASGSPVDRGSLATTAAAAAVTVTAMAALPVLSHVPVHSVDVAGGSVPSTGAAPHPSTLTLLHDSDDSPDLSDPPGPSRPVTSHRCHDNKRLKFLLPVAGRKKTPPPFAASRLETQSEYAPLSPSPPATDSSIYEGDEMDDDDDDDDNDDEEEKEDEDGEGGGRVAENDVDEKEEEEEKEAVHLIGEDGLLNVFALRQDAGQRLSGLNKRFQKYRVRQDTIRRLLTYIQHVIGETDHMNSLLASARDQIESLAKEASQRRDGLAAVCDLAVSIVGKAEGQIQKVEPSCYRRYSKIRNASDCTNLLALVHTKRKALRDLEVLIQRKHLVQQNALPVMVNEASNAKPTAIKKPTRFINRGGLKGSKFNKMLFGKNSDLKPVVLEVIPQPLQESGSNTVTTDGSSSTPAPSDNPLSLVATVHSAPSTVVDTSSHSRQ